MMPPRAAGQVGTMEIETLDNLVVSGLEESEEPEERDARISMAVKAEYVFVWRLLRRLGVLEPEADDVAQRVFLIFASKIGRIHRGAERAFLAACARRVASRERRKQARRAEEELERVDWSTSSTAEDLVEQRRARALLDSILMRLSEKYRVVFVLYEIEELTTAEIAELLELPHPTVRSRLRRARDEFAAQVARLRGAKSEGLG